MAECYFTSTETVGLLETGAQDGHLDFHTAPELWTSYAKVPGKYKHKNTEIFLVDES